MSCHVMDEEAPSRDPEGPPTGGRATVTTYICRFGWREWNTLQSANFDALADDQEGALDKINRNMADYVLDGDANIKFQGYTAYGLRNSSLTKLINLGSAAGGANIDLTTATPDELEAFFVGPFGAMLDANLITEAVNLYISLEIARAWDRSYSSAEGFKQGTVREFVARNRRIAKIEVTHKLSGNQFFGFVPNARFVRPLVGMAVNTTAITRLNPTDNYQFLVMGALGIEVRGDYNGKSALSAMTTVNGYDGRMTVAPYRFDNTSGVGFHVKSSHMYISASRTGPGSVGTANVTVDAVGAVGPVDFIVYRMSGDAAIEASLTRWTDTTAPFQHVFSFDADLTNQTRQAVFGCSARDAAGNTGSVVIEVQLFYNDPN